jgi:hypothetical protein
MNNSFRHVMDRPTGLFKQVETALVASIDHLLFLRRRRLKKNEEINRKLEQLYIQNNIRILWDEDRIIR